MKHCADEHQQVKILEKKVKELDQLKIKYELSQKYLEALLKVNTAVNLIKKIESPQKRDRNLKIIQETYAKEICLLKQIPNIEKISSENKSLSLILQY